MLRSFAELKEFSVLNDHRAGTLTDLPGTSSTTKQLYFWYQTILRLHLDEDHSAYNRSVAH